MAWQSKTRIGGIPLVSVGGYARGFISIGFMGIGVINFSQFGMGIISFNQFGAGIISIAQFGIGEIVIGQFAVGILAAVGQFALGFAVGGAAGFGYYDLTAFDFLDQFVAMGQAIISEPLPMALWGTVWLVGVYYYFRFILKIIRAGVNQ